MKHWIPVVLFALSLSSIASEPEPRFVQVAAQTREERTRLVDAGMSIEFVRSDSVWGFANGEILEEIESIGFKVLGNFHADVARGGHTPKKSGPGFPRRDARYHDYAEVRDFLQRLSQLHPERAKVHTIGKSYEGRDIFALQINTDPFSLSRGKSNKPGAIFLGAHHAREHLSTEIPLLLAEYLLNNKTDPKISALLDSRDIWFVPLVNPDGSEHDISTGRYLSWRKNRRPNGDGTFGVDLNRNYGFQWGTGGSSARTSSDVYKGPQPFSEPETLVVKSFIENHLNAKVLLSFHTFSELILYPWGHKYDDVETARDLQVFETMARTMSQWNKYKPQQASDLYIASGDTTDWAYGEHGIFAFTFELTPSSQWDGGFYPGAKAIDPTFAANVLPSLYLIELADDPYRVLSSGPSTEETPKDPRGSTWPKNTSNPRTKFEIHPLPF